MFEHLKTSMKRHGFSGVAGIYREGEDAIEVAAGLSDRKARIPNSVDTRFGMASGTKFLTAVAIGKLIQTGRLTLDTRLRDCVALDFPAYPEGITIQHLLTHTSGIPDYYDEETVEDFENFAVGVPWNELRGPRDYLQVFPRTEMKFRPGERFSYCNGAYILLGVVIEELTGRQYRDFVTDEILKPVGMNRSGFFPMENLPEGTAIGYLGKDDGLRTNAGVLPVIGASDGGAFTTVKDMRRLWEAWWGGDILSGDLVKTFSSPFVAAPSEGPDIHYGHGIWVFRKGRVEEYITGCDAGVSFESRVDRKAGIQVTVLSNTTHGAWPVLKDIRTAIEGGLLDS